MKLALFASSRNRRKDKKKKKKEEKRDLTGSDPSSKNY